MNTAFKKRQAKFFIQLLVLSLTIVGVHSYLLHYFADNMLFFFPLWQVYIFHVIVTTVLYSIINYRYSSGKTDVFNIFMIATFLKMTLAIVFLLPLLLSDSFENKQPDVFNFFIPYFLYLFFEVYSLTLFLQKK